MTTVLFLAQNLGPGFTDRVRSYESLAAVKSDSDLTGTPAVSAAEAWFGQEWHGRKFKVGRRDAGDADWSAAFDAVVAEDPDFFYVTCESRVSHDAVGSDGMDELAATVDAASMYLFVTQTSDSDVKAGTAGNGFDVMKTAGYKNVLGIWHEDDTEYADCALCAKLAVDPDIGITTAAWQRLSGITAQDSQLTDTEKSTISSYYGNVYMTAAGVGVMQKGETFDGGYIDQRVSALWAKWRIDQAITQALIDRASVMGKVPYTNAGIQYLAGKVKNVLSRGERIGHFATGSSVVNAPDIADVSASDKQNRILHMTATTTLAGAIGSVTINVYVGV